MVMLGRCCSCIKWGKDSMKRFVEKFIPFENAEFSREEE